MSLTQQFYLVVLLPVGFLFLALIHLRIGSERRGLSLPWLLALLTAAVWASGSLTYYSGVGIPLGVRFGWRLSSNYALTLLPISLLWTTSNLLVLPAKRKKFWLGFSFLLWLLALGLDPAIWPYRIPTFELADEPVRHLEVWGVFWVISWLFPGLAAWGLTRQTARELPGSLYRNQLSYWTAAVFIMLTGTAIGLPRQLGWRELGELLALSGAIIGVLAIGRSHLPDYSLALRRLWSRILAALLLFALTWWALWLVIPLATPSTETEQELAIVFIAGVLAFLFLLINHLVQRLASRIFLPPAVIRDETLLRTADRLSHNFRPTAVARQALALVEDHLGAAQSWFMTVHDGGWGRLTLQPFIWSGLEPTAALLGHESALGDYFLTQSGPILHFDLVRLPVMQTLSTEEKQLLENWPAVIYVPWHNGGRLVGLLGAGSRPEPELYTNPDLQFLAEMADRFAPLLAQAQTVSALYEVGNYVASQYQLVHYDNQRLRQANLLYHDFFNLLGPELRQPYEPLEQQLNLLQDKLEQSGHLTLAAETEALLESARLPLNQAKQSVNKLIGLAARLQKQTDFQFAPVRLDELARDTIHSLTTMAEARRVEIDFSQHGLPLTVWGDAQRLREAMSYLLHNAIKFSKIGGGVQAECSSDGQEVSFRVVDSGVGIPEARLATIWVGLPDLGHAQERTGKSAGLGLRLTRFIIQAHGGRLEASSAYGQGSSFTFYLPLRHDLTAVERREQ